MTVLYFNEVLKRARERAAAAAAKGEIERWFQQLKRRTKLSIINLGFVLSVRLSGRHLYFLPFFFFFLCARCHVGILSWTLFDDKLKFFVSTFFATSLLYYSYLYILLFILRRWTLRRMTAMIRRQKCWQLVFRINYARFQQDSFYRVKYILCARSLFQSVGFSGICRL